MLDSISQIFMPDSIDIYLQNDSYKPPAPLPSLQQYDNYQIYSLFCVDRNFEATIAGVQNDYSSKFNNWLAVQIYSPYRKIPCNFTDVISNHP